MDKPFALIVEDDRDVVALFRHVLDVAGYHTEIVLDGKSAMERLKAIRPDVVLLDLQLPGISGVDILQNMRADNHMKTVPVMVITAYAYYTNSLPVEPDLVLLKPVDVQQLSALVQRLKATYEPMREPPYDVVTKLYTSAFFTVRATYALERIKVSEFRRFGVLFADLSPYNTLKEAWDEKTHNQFLRNMAEHLKGTLRPVDTIAWSGEGHFLALLEEITSEEDAQKIVERVKNGMDTFLSENPPAVTLESSVGILVCDSEYENIQKILEDVVFARTILRQKSSTSNDLFDRQKIRLQRKA